MPTAEPTLAFAQPTVSTPTTTPPVAAITTPAAHLYVAFITPRDVVLSAGDVINFEVQAFDLSGNRLRDITVRWAAQGGVMQSAGVYEAGKDAGVFAIFATVIYKDQKLPVVTTVVIQ